jgi:16S rRNA (guanine527-N7)-methyltransferase
MFHVKRRPTCAILGAMTALPALTRDQLGSRLRELSPEPLSAPALAALVTHYEELRRWAPRLALIGPGTADEVLERHFGESLAALPLVPERPADLAADAAGEIVDVGSGAGFPALVLAAVRPRWRVTLVEARQRKWAFLMSVARRASLSCRCLNARVGDPLPEGVPARFDLLTARAIRLPAADLGLLLDRLTPAGRALLWAGDADPDLPPGHVAETAVPLPGSERRRIVEVRRTPHEAERP